MKWQATIALLACVSQPAFSQDNAKDGAVMILSACSELWATDTFKEMMAALGTIQGEFGLFAARFDTTVKAALATYGSAKDAYVITFAVDPGATGEDGTKARDQLDRLVTFAAEPEGLFDQAVDYAVGTQTPLRDVVDLSRAVGNNTDSGQAEQAMKDARIAYLKAREESNTYYDLMMPVLSCAYDQREHLAANGQVEDESAPRDPPEMFIQFKPVVGDEPTYRIGFEARSDEHHEMSPLVATVDGSPPRPHPEECRSLCLANQRCVGWNYVLPEPAEAGKIPMCEIYHDDNTTFTNSVMRNPSYISGYGPAAVAKGYALLPD